MPLRRDVELHAAESVFGALQSLLTPQDDLDITVSTVKLGTLGQTAYQFYSYMRDRDGRINRETFRMAWVTAHPTTQKLQVWLAYFHECIIENPTIVNLGAQPRMHKDPQSEVGVASEYQYAPDQSVKAGSLLFTFFNTGKRPPSKTDAADSPFHLPHGRPHKIDLGAMA